MEEEEDSAPSTPMDDLHSRINHRVRQTLGYISYLYISAEYIRTQALSPSFTWTTSTPASTTGSDASLHLHVIHIEHNAAPYSTKIQSQLSHCHNCSLEINNSPYPDFPHWKNLTYPPVHTKLTLLITSGSFTKT